MRTGRVSFAALIAAASMGFAVAPTWATGNQAAMPPLPAMNWPPQPPSIGTPAAPAEAKPEPPVTAPPAASIALPAPVIAVPSSPPAVEAAPEKPVFALFGELTERLKREKVAGGDREDRDAAAKFYEARQGAPVWVTEKGFTDKAMALMNEIRAADSYGLQSSAYKLPAHKWTADLAPAATDLADAEATLTLAALRYARHARGGRFDPTSLSKNIDRKPVIYGALSVLTELAGSTKPEAYLRGFHPQHPQFERLRLKYIALKSGQSVIEPPKEEPAAVETGKGKTKQVAKKPPAAPSPAALERKLLANMEMWRWMPVDLGDAYIQNNIPEFTTKVVRGGKVIHLERIVTGKSNTQTPVFSDEMQTVVFKPFWNVPESIKWKELQPQLSQNPGALSKAGLRVAYNGKELDPSTVDWQTADMRVFHVFQPPGSGNALGQVKFLFPNKHDVYMHDTPQKSLFNNAARAYSHGCMRVRDPLKFAEILLGNDKGWDMAKIVQLANAGPENNEVRLTKKVPIHVTYFTAVVDDDGKLKTFADLYDHESKVHMGLEGKAHLIAQPKEEKYTPAARGQVRFVSSQQKSSNPLEAWMKNVFNF
jgi:murein L,D-transpeptidase YcbB/YkuD